MGDKTYYRIQRPCLLQRHTSANPTTAINDTCLSQQFLNKAIYDITHLIVFTMLDVCHVCSLYSISVYGGPFLIQGNQFNHTLYPNSYLYLVYNDW